MTAAPVLLGLLLASAAQNVTVEPLADDGYRLTVIVSATDPQAQFRGQLRLMREAERRCRGRAALSEGVLEANQVPGRRGRIALSETYRCVSPAGP